LGLSTCTFLSIVSLHAQGICILGGRRGGLSYATRVLDFSHEEVKPVVVVTYRFFLFIARTA